MCLDAVLPFSLSHNCPTCLNARPDFVRRCSPCRLVYPGGMDDVFYLLSFILCLLSFV
jgi:hypothetical protein